LPARLWEAFRCSSTATVKGVIAQRISLLQRLTGHGI
jgi:hypothetical protein